MSKLRFFISYRRDDEPAITAKIYEAFADYYDEENVFFDKESLPAGVKWKERIEERVAECSVMLVVIGSKWLNLLESKRHKPEIDMVRYEIERALHHSKVIAPIYVNGCSHIHKAKLPPELAKLTAFQSESWAPSANIVDKCLEMMIDFDTELSGIGDGTNIATEKSNNDTVEVEIVVDLSIADAARVALVIANLVKLSIKKVRIVDKKQGSTIVTLELPRDVAEKLLKLAKEQPELFERIQGVSMRVGDQRVSLQGFTDTPQEEQQLFSQMIMPTPFEWIDIPDKGYSIAKYPITNAQFRKFVDAGGYNTKRWWTQQGWQKRLEGWHYEGDWKASGKPWTEPLQWDDSKWNGDLQPIVGVSWFESVAFCKWLSDTTGENIMLPTEDQWQYASQGNDRRNYPWGNDWDCQRCNNATDPCKSNITTLVTQYEGEGDSPFGVVDMAGNVWEWCLTDHQAKTDNMNSVARHRVLRGGSWLNTSTSFFSCEMRYRGIPYARDNNGGFRIVRLK